MADIVIDRKTFVARWEGKAEGAADPFDQFFSLWIALVIRARPLLKVQELGSKDTDRAAVIRLSQKTANGIFKALQDVRGELMWLAARKGTSRGDPIVDVHESAPNRDHLRTRFRWLAEHYADKRQCKPGLIVEAVAELLNHVRNNLFHGIKNPDDVDDQELVRNLIPVLRAVLRGSGV
jgi:hypothetical protein